MRNPANAGQATGDDSSTAAGIIKKLKGIMNIEVNQPGCCVVEGFRLTERLGQEHFAKCCLPDKKSVYRTRSGRFAARAVYYSSEHTFLPHHHFYFPAFTLRLLPSTFMQNHLYTFKPLNPSPLHLQPHRFPLYLYQFNQLGLLPELSQICNAAKCCTNTDNKLHRCLLSYMKDNW